MESVLNEEIGSLDAPAPIERVIDEDSARLVTRAVLLGTLDASIYDFDETVLTDTVVPVLSETDQEIGTAHIALDNESGRITAELVFDYASPDRLIIESQSYPLYPHIEGAFAVMGDIAPACWAIRAHRPDRRLDLRVIDISAVRLSPRKPEDFTVHAV